MKRVSWNIQVGLCNYNGSDKTEAEGLQWVGVGDMTPEAVGWSEQERGHETRDSQDDL